MSIGFIHFVVFVLTSLAIFLSSLDYRYCRFLFPVLLLASVCACSLGEQHRWHTNMLNSLADDGNHTLASLSGSLWLSDAQKT